MEKFQNFVEKYENWFYILILILLLMILGILEITISIAAGSPTWLEL